MMGFIGDDACDSIIGDDACDSSGCSGATMFFLLLSLPIIIYLSIYLRYV